MKKYITFISFLLVFLLFFTNYSFASESEFPTLPDWKTDWNYNTDQCEYLVFKGFDGSIYLYIFPYSRTGLEFKFYKYDNTLLTVENFGSSTQFDRAIYKLESGSWKTQSLSSVKNNETLNISMTEQFELYETSIPVYMSKTSEEIFFPVPPTPTTPTVEEMIAEEVPTMAEKVIQTMKIILLCGVGCLALLIGLPILLKVLYRFL